MRSTASMAFCRAKARDRSDAQTASMTAINATRIMADRSRQSGIFIGFNLKSRPSNDQDQRPNHHLARVVTRSPARLSPHLPASKCSCPLLSKVYT